jgi:prepilin-type N-terminal cleavage/methylation domain-containing protein
MPEQSSKRSRSSGFTLLELMVTMAIAASLMGLGAGLFTTMGRRTAAENALASTSSIVVNVRNASSRFPAMIAVDPEAGTVQAMAQEVRQELHFDPRAFEGVAEPQYAKGIEGRDCDWLGASPEPTSGRVGGALRLSGGRVDCGNYAAYDVTDGISVELYVRSSRSARSRASSTTSVSRASTRRTRS